MLLSTNEQGREKRKREGERKREEGENKFERKKFVFGLYMRVTNDI